MKLVFNFFFQIEEHGRFNNYTVTSMETHAVGIRMGRGGGRELRGFSDNNLHQIFLFLKRICDSYISD